MAGQDSPRSGSSLIDSMYEPSISPTAGPGMTVSELVGPQSDRSEHAAIEGCTRPLSGADYPAPARAVATAGARATYQCG